MNDSQPPKHEQPSFRFSLRTLMVVVTAACIAVSLWTWLYWLPEQRRREGVAEYGEAAAPFQEVAKVGGYAQRGADRIVSVSFHPTVNDADLARLRPKLEAIRGLEAASLQGASVTDAGLKELEGLTQLRELHLGRTRITDAGLKYIASMSRLETLSLLNTAVTDAGLEHLAGLKKMTWLELYHTKVTEAGVNRLAETLELTPHTSPHKAGGVFYSRPGNAAPHKANHMASSRERSEAAFERILALGGSGVWESDMVVVSLEGTAVTDDDLALFEDFDFVQILSLADTQITDAGLVHLEKLVKLDSLILVNTKVTEVGLARLRDVLPDVTIDTEPVPEGTINPFTGKPIGE